MTEALPFPTLTPGGGHKAEDNPNELTTSFVPHEGKSLEVRHPKAYKLLPKAELDNLRAVEHNLRQLKRDNDAQADQIASLKALNKNMVGQVEECQNDIMLLAGNIASRERIIRHHQRMRAEMRDEILSLRLMLKLPFRMMWHTIRGRVLSLHARARTAHQAEQLATAESIRRHYN